MAVDHEGNALTTGDNVWVPMTLTGTTSTGVTGTTSYGSSSVTLLGTQVHKDKPRSFPDAP